MERQAWEHTHTHSFTIRKFMRFIKLPTENAHKEEKWPKDFSIVRNSVNLPTLIL